MIKTLPPLTLQTLAEHMLWVEGGEFMMGGEVYERERPIHRVQVSVFEICRYQVSQALWQAVMGSYPAALPHPERPVEQVSWYDSVDFCNELSKKQGYQPAYQIERERKDPNNQNEDDDQKWTVSLIEGADGFRLPTEAEWEYAARGGRYGQGDAYADSPNEDEVAHWRRNSQDISQPVGLKIPNALGLFDMSGNVYEWVWDWYDGNYYQACAEKGIVPNPTGPPIGSSRGARGASTSLTTCGRPSATSIFHSTASTTSVAVSAGTRPLRAVTLCFFYFLSKAKSRLRDTLFDRAAVTIFFLAIFPPVLTSQVLSACDEGGPARSVCFFENQAASPRFLRKPPPSVRRGRPGEGGEIMGRWLVS